MSGRPVHCNRVSLTGEIVTVPVFSHETMGERFYLAYIAIRRLSGRLDTLPLMLSEQLIDYGEDFCGRSVEVLGEMRSYNMHCGARSKLLLQIFVREFRFLNEEAASEKTNQIYLDGVICKFPVYRHTPLGRQITDLFLAVRRPYGKSDYIPCIAWGVNAMRASGFDVSERIQLWGRVQSREYQKRIGKDETVKHTAYEVSINTLEYCQPAVDFSCVSC